VISCYNDLLVLNLYDATVMQNLILLFAIIVAFIFFVITLFIEISCCQPFIGIFQIVFGGILAFVSARMLFGSLKRRK